MSTFVVRFVGDPSQGFRGRVRHIATGEEIGFTCVRELVAFFEELNAIRGSFEDLVEKPLTPPQQKKIRSNQSDGNSLGRTETDGGDGNV